MPLTIFTRFSYTEKDRQEQESSLVPVETWRLRRRNISNAGVLFDRIALHKTLNLCHACIHKMGRKFPRNVHYSEITAFHCHGHCDGCRAETSLTIFVWEGSRMWEGQQALSRIKAIKDREARVRKLRGA